MIFLSIVKFPTISIIEWKSTDLSGQYTTVEYWKLNKTLGYPRESFRPPMLLKVRFWEKLPVYVRSM